MSGGGGGGGGQDPTYYYNIERDRQEAQMKLMREQMAQQREAADRVAAQQAEQTKLLQEEAARVKAEKDKQAAENAAKQALVDERRQSRTIGGFNSWATNGYGGFGGASRSLGGSGTLG